MGNILAVGFVEKVAEAVGEFAEVERLEDDRAQGRMDCIVRRRTAGDGCQRLGG